MFEIDVLGVGDKKNAEAIGVRFSHPITGIPVHLLIDGGWQQDGSAVVEHINTLYGGRLDLVVSTHPDGDHIGGLGDVIRHCSVNRLWIHRPVRRGAPNESGFKAAEELVHLALAYGADVEEPFAGQTAFGDALLICGPTQTYYQTCLQAQLDEKQRELNQLSESVRALIERSASWLDRQLDWLPGDIDLPFPAGYSNARNNSSVILSLVVGQNRFLFTADAGVPALAPALDLLDASPHSSVPLRMFKLPHHGARAYLDSDTIDRVLGGQAHPNGGCALVSIAPEADGNRYPSGRVSNRCLTRGYPVYENPGKLMTLHGDGSTRSPGTPLRPLPPLREEDE